MIRQTVLLIEASPAIQAIASLALTNINMSVRTLSNGQNAIETARKLKPNLIICGKDVPGLDTLGFCRKIRATSAYKKTGFIILVPRDQLEAFANPAQQAGCDDIITKPFRSEQLQNIAKRTLDKFSGEESAKAQVLLLAPPSALQRAIERVILKRNAGVKYCESLSALQASAKQGKFDATILDSTMVADIKWYDPTNLGVLVMLVPPQELGIPAASKSQAVRVISRPLSNTAISKLLDELLGESGMDLPADPPQLEPRETALLAARISAAVYESLLNQPALSSGNWNEASTLARDEVVRICKELERLITAR